MLNKQIAAALSLLVVMTAAGCATTANTNDKEAYEEPEYTTGSNIPRKGTASKIDANSPEGRALLDQMTAARAAGSTGPNH